MDIFEHYRRILDTLIDDEDWIEWLQYPYEGDIKQYNETIYCATGVSRCALIDEEYDWIVKWDFQDYEFCDKEEHLSARAKFYNVEDMIAPAIYIGSYINEEKYISLQLYAYPRAISFSSYRYNYLSKEEEEEISESPLAQRNELIAAAFIQDWGFDKFEALSEFCEDCDINDIHTGNVGIIRGKIVLIDYAGFHSSSSSETDQYNLYKTFCTTCT